MSQIASKEESVARKIAVVIASLPDDKAVKIMKLLSPEAVQRVASELQSLGEVREEAQREAFAELAGVMNKGQIPKGGENRVKGLLSAVVGEQDAAAMMDKVKKSHAFSQIANVGGQDLATILSKEQPSTAALILGFLSAKKTGEILEFLEPEFREDIIVHLAKRRTTDSEVIERVEKIFVEKVQAIASPDGHENVQNMLGGADYVAEVFQNVERTTEEELMNSIQEASEELAEEVRDLMFTFEDIITLSDMDMQKVMREVPMDKLVIALRGVSREIHDKFTNNLSKRARENLAEEMELSGKVKMSDIESERRKIVQIVRSLEAAGEIVLTRGEEGDEYI